MAELDILQEPVPIPANKGLSKGSIVLIAGLIMVTMVFALQLSYQNQVQPKRGETAPNIEITTYDGETLRLADLRGKVVIVNFWGSWCIECGPEAAELQAIWEDYKDNDVVMLGVAWLDTDKDALAFIDEHGITYPNGPDIGENNARRYKITGAPENFIINREGVIAEAIIGPVTYGRLKTIIDRVLVGES